MDRTEDLIWDYLERVRIYLPIGSDDLLREIRTHLLEAAEDIGRGQVTPGAVMLAIEQLGDPKTVANEYAGTGRTKGPVPVELVTPLVRSVLVVAGIGVGLITASLLVGPAIAAALGEAQGIAVSVLTSVALGLCMLVALVIGVHVLESKGLPTEKTVLDMVLDVGTGPFQPPSRLSASVATVMLGIGAILVVHPSVMPLYSAEFRVFVPAIAVLLLLAAVLSLALTAFGENNLLLVVNVVLSAVWIWLVSQLVYTGWPTTYAWACEDGGCHLVSISEVLAENPPLGTVLDVIWLAALFLVVVLSVWETNVAISKVVYYLHIGRGLWWTGTWGCSWLLAWIARRRGLPPP